MNVIHICTVVGLLDDVLGLHVIRVSFLFQCSRSRCSVITDLYMSLVFTELADLTPQQVLD